MDADIIIIGAGAAGLNAAYELSANKKVLILEARDRIGGRIHTIQEGFNSDVELGAEFIHGKLPATFQLIEKAGIAVTETGGVPIRVENGKFSKRDFSFEHWDEFVKQLKLLKSDLSLAAFLKQYFNESKYDKLRRSVIGYAEGYDAADTHLASTLALREEWLDESDEAQYRLAGGYSNLMNYLAEKIRFHGGTIHLNAVVQRIDWLKHNVKVFASNKVYTSKQIIITTPLGILKSGDIEFVPAIPEYANAIQQMGYGHVIKLLFEFKHKFWESIMDDPAIKRMGFLFTGKSIPTWWTQYPGKSALLTGWLAGPQAFKMKDKSDDELLATSMLTLSETFRMSEQELSQIITAKKVINWSNDPFAKGAYSYATTQTIHAREILVQPIEDTIWFAGEAIYKGPEMGTVEAALASGKNVAGEILGDF